MYVLCIYIFVGHPDVRRGFCDVLSSLRVLILLVNGVLHNVVIGVSGSQAAGDAQGEERQSLSAAAAGAGFKAAAEQGRSLVIDVVLSTGPYLPLKGDPRRISCRYFFLSF